MPINRPRMRTHRFACFLLVCTTSGCGAPLALLDDANSEEPPRVVRDERPAILENATLEQLVTLIEDSQKEANELVTMLSAPQNQSFRLARLQQHVVTGVTAADK